MTIASEPSMLYIRDEPIVLDTNEFGFALRRDSNFPACERLLFDRVGDLNIFMPLQILIELQHNLASDEMRMLLLAVSKAKSILFDYAPAPLDLVKDWHVRGAKKGDDVIIAHLQAAGIRCFVTENRHFLVELPGLPFDVLTSDQVLQRLDLPH